VFWASYLIIAIVIATLALAFVRRLLFTFILLVSNVVIFLIIVATSDIGYFYSLSTWELGFHPNYLLTGQDLFTLVTSMFIHASPMHIAFNMIWLVVIGMMFEERAGKLTFGLVYFIAGVIGGLVFAVTYEFQAHWSIGATGPVVGASGALYGIFGALVRLYPNERLRIYFLDFPLYIWFLIFLGLDIVMGIFQPLYSIFGPVA
jgi:membrane associated rhomboid family serine protease